MKESTLRERFEETTIWAGGKVVMFEGDVFDEEWWREKKRRARRVKESGMRYNQSEG